MNDYDSETPMGIEESREASKVRFGSEPFELVHKPKICKKEYHTFGSYLVKHHVIKTG